MEAFSVWKALKPIQKTTFHILKCSIENLCHKCKKVLNDKGNYKTFNSPSKSFLKLSCEELFTT